MWGGIGSEGRERGGIVLFLLLSPLTASFDCSKAIIVGEGTELSSWLCHNNNWFYGGFFPNSDHERCIGKSGYVEQLFANLGMRLAGEIGGGGPVHGQGGNWGVLYISF